MSTSAHERVSRARELGLPTPEDSGNEEQTPLSAGLDSQRQRVEFRLTAEEQIVREAILSVIDDGCRCYEEKHPWEFYEELLSTGNDPLTEDVANQQRLRFADAVIARARRIKQVDAEIALERNESTTLTERKLCQHGN